MREPRITAVICTHERYDLLARAVDSVAAQTLEAGTWRILVIDNSPDADRARAFGGRFRHLPQFSYIHENSSGLSNARNLAASICDTDFIAYLDDDAVASGGWLAAILDAFDRFGEDAAVVGGRVRPLWEAPRPAWLHDKMLGSLSLVDWGGALRLATEREWFCGANIAFRTEVMTECGGFSTHLGRKGASGALLSNEEIQLVGRIRARGGALIYAPDAVVDHRVSHDRLTHAWFRKRMSWQAVSDFLMESDGASPTAEERWLGVRDYLAARPVPERGLAGLLLDTDDPELFHWQLGAIYSLTAGMLGGFEGLSLG